MNRSSNDVGPIGVSENGRYFVDQNGEPFFWLGDTQWQLFRDFTLEEAEIILEDRKNKGFTAIHIMITGVGNGSIANVAGDIPWVDNDPATPNEAYFKHVDSVMELGRQKGLILVPGVFHQLQRSVITMANALSYATWIAERYRDLPNIVWSMYPRAEQEYVPVLRELAAGLQDGDNGVHLISVHPDPAPTSSSFIHSESWMACNMVQPWVSYQRIYDMVTNDYYLTPTKPVIMAEGAYEDEDDSEYGIVIAPLLVRKQAYWSYLAGGHHSYGHTNNWKAPSKCISALDAPGAFQMGILRDIFTAQKWWELVPDQSVFAGEENRNSTVNLAARSLSGDWIIVYLSSPTSFAINMEKMPAGDLVDACWMDPVTGQQTKIGRFSNTGTQSLTTPPGWEDAVLLLETATH